MNKRIEDLDITQESVDDFFRSPEMKQFFKNFKHMLRGYKPIKRTRKRQIAKAKHMMDWHDIRVTSGHSGGARQLENLRGGVSEAITVMCGDYLCNSNYHHCDCL